MSKVVKDKFLTEFDEYQENNGMYGGKRYTKSDNEKWKANQPLSEEEKARYAKREKTGFIVLIAGVSILFFGAIIFMMMQ